MRMTALLRIGFSFRASARARPVRIGLREFYSGAPRLGQSDRNRLLGRPRAMLSLAHMMNLFAHQFACLHGRRFAFGLVFARPSESFLFRHLPYPLSGEFSKGNGNTYATAAKSMT